MEAKIQWVKIRISSNSVLENLWGILYQFALSYVNRTGQNEITDPRTMFSYILFCMGDIENKWNDPTATTGKKTCAANVDMMDRVYYEILVTLVAL